MSYTGSFGDWLKQHRVALDLTQEQLGLEVNCSGEHIRKIEANKRHPSVQVAKLLAEYFQIPPEERDIFVRFARRAGTYEVVSDVPTGARVNEDDLKRNTPSNLPSLLNSFVGREKEKQELGNLLRQNQIRLVVLTGTGGTGKTRLAVQVASGLLSEFEHGIYWVNLAPVTDHNLVVHTIATTLGVHETPSESLLETLKTHLQDKRMLLVLDNFEQVLEASPVVAELLLSAPKLKMLVTSRSVLHIYGEREFALKPMTVPPIGNKLLSIEQLDRFDVVQLFVERTQNVQSDFQLTSSNMKVIAQICARLDGLPLAVELAAARMRIFSVEVLLNACS